VGGDIVGLAFGCGETATHCVIVRLEMWVAKYLDRWKDQDQDKDNSMSKKQEARDGVICDGMFVPRRSCDMI